MVSLLVVITWQTSRKGKLCRTLFQSHGKQKKIVLRTSGLACPFPLDLVLTCVDSFVSKKYILWLYVSLIESYFFIQTFRK